MSNNSYTLDPEGDVMLLLKNANAAIAEWDESQEGSLLLSVDSPSVQPSPRSLEQVEEEFFFQLKVKKEKKSSKEGKRKIIWPVSSPESSHEQSQFPGCELPLVEPEPEQIEARIRVSSRHLILASAYFKRMLGGGWKEHHTLDVNGDIPIHMETWCPEALLILMNIIHGKTREVPRSINLELLANIAILVDYYKCAEAVEVFKDIWITELKKDLPTSYGKELILWICITWVFQLPEEFKTLSRVAITQAPEPIQTLELPIPDRITRSIDEQRQKSISRIADVLTDYRGQFLQRQDSCSFKCDSFLLGALTKQMHSRNLLAPLTEAQRLGVSFSGLAEAVRNMSSPSWAPEMYSNRSCACTFENTLYPIIESLEEDIKGLALEDEEEEICFKFDLRWNHKENKRLPPNDEYD